MVLPPGSAIGSSKARDLSGWHILSHQLARYSGFGLTPQDKHRRVVGVGKGPNVVRRRGRDGELLGEERGGIGEGGGGK